jgi:phenylpropionate dioxygenase-like ring-hydroxylating dioxygenase large terminal subunit
VATAVADDVLRPEELAGLGKSPEEARGLPPRLYTDPAVYEAEKERIFRREWMPVFHQTTVPKPGDYRVVDLAGESLLFVRGEDGKLRGFHNICRHRGAKVATGEGSCGKFKCPYHSWTYDLSGNLIGAPEMAHVVREGIGLVELRLETWLGFVFVNQDGQAEPLSEKLADLNEILAPWVAVADDLEVLYEIPYPGTWNWKLSMENAIESYHIIGSHFESAGELLPPELSYTESTEFRHWTDFRSPFGSGMNMRDTTDGSVTIANVPDWVDEEFRFYPVWPAILVSLAPENVTAYFAIPGATPGEVTFMWSGAVLPATKEKANFEQYKAGQVGFSTTIQGEDQYPCETMWANVHSDAFIPGPYAAQERAVYHFDQWYLERMSS